MRKGALPFFSRILKLWEMLSSMKFIFVTLNIIDRLLLRLFKFNIGKSSTELIYIIFDL